MWNELDSFFTDTAILSRKKVQTSELEDSNLIVSFRFLLKILNKNFDFILHKVDNERTIVEYNNIKLFNNNNNTVYINDPVVLLDYIPSYSHFLMDILGKFFYIKKYFPDVKPFFVMPDKEETDHYKKTTHAFNEILSAICQDLSDIKIIDIKNNNDSFIFNQAYSIAPSGNLSSQLFYQNKDSILSLRNSFLPKRQSLNNRNIFIPRESLFSKRSKDLEQLKKILIYNNYEILYFENLTFEEQINAFYDAKNIIALDGSSLVNVLFANKDSNILGFHSDPRFFTYEWAVISSYLDINFSNIYVNDKKINNIFKIFESINLNSNDLDIK